MVFGQEGDLEILGARTLEGLNLVVDPTRKRLVAGGPVPAAPNGQRQAHLTLARTTVAQLADETRAQL